MTTATSSPVAPRWQVFSAAPHRMLFLPGALQLLIPVAWWLVVLLGRAAGWAPPSLPVAPMHVHLFLMLFGVFPFFIFGFLFTVYPRWMNQAPLPRSLYVTAFWLLTSGMALFYAGMAVGTELLALGVAVFLAGWVTGLVGLLGVYWQAQGRERQHETVLNAALLAGVLGLAAFEYGLLTGDARAFALAGHVGLWLFLVPVLFTVSHRMIPFFSQSVLARYSAVRPSWSLAVLAAAAVGHVVLTVLDLRAWLILVDLPLFALSVHHLIIWRFWRSVEVGLLAMLYVAFAWFGVATLFYSIQSAGLLLAGVDVVGRAPLHALGIGFLAGMVIAMVSRVTLGHSGRRLESDRLTWYTLLGINIAAVLRIAAEFTAAPTLNVLAAVAWLASILPWAWHYAPMYLRPRIDQRPG